MIVVRSINCFSMIYFSVFCNIGICNSSSTIGKKNVLLLCSFVSILVMPLIQHGLMFSFVMHNKGIIYVQKANNNIFQKGKVSNNKERVFVVTCFPIIIHSHIGECAKSKKTKPSNNCFEKLFYLA